MHVIGPIQIDVVSQSPTPAYVTNVTGEIGTALAPVVAECTGEIIVYADGGACPCTGEIAADEILPPTNPLAANLNHGAIAIKWGHPEPNRIRYYEVYAGFSPAGPFYQYPTVKSDSLFCLLNNFPIGTTAYMRVRAIGKNGLASSFANVKRAIFSTIEGTLQVTGISGSTIQAGTRFSQIDPNTGTVVSFRVKDTFTI